MLDRAGDTDGDVQLWSNDLAGLTDLHVVGYETCVDRGARGPHGGAQLVGHAVQQLEVVAVLHAAPAGDDDLRRSQLRPLGLGDFLADEAGDTGVSDAGDGLDAGRAALARHGVEAGTTHGQHLDGGRGLHGGDGVAGVDRPLEGVRALDLDDLGDLVDIQQRGDARQHVLAGGGGGGQHVAVTLAQFGDQRRDVLRQLVGEGGVVGDQHLAHASDLGGGFGNGGARATCDQHVDVATDLLSGGHGVQGRSTQRCVVVLSDNQDSHQITFASFFSFSTSSATDLTLMPALRAAGASTLRVFTVEAVDTPSASGVTTSSGFFLAFMMLGREA
ncbi:hypothetical protein D3C75_704300 [compost metagenome]